ncbi:hypothetical protein C8J57DRAFT_1405749 [Mycena rebaudengoi]|nr:hypothetical protein C8J57DRAFT_1405749 [Mycena rebaudengoi]
MSLHDILQQLAAYPRLIDVTLAQATEFVRLAACVKRDIDLAQPARQSFMVAPDVLLPSVSKFLSSAVGIPLEDIPAMWMIFKKEVWIFQAQDCAALLEDEVFKVHGWGVGITSLSIYPPTTTCTTPDCS